MSCADLVDELCRRERIGDGYEAWRAELENGGEYEWGEGIAP